MAVDVLGGRLCLTDAAHAVEGRGEDRRGAAGGQLVAQFLDEVVAAGEVQVAGWDITPDRWRVAGLSLRADTTQEATGPERCGDWLHIEIGVLRFHLDLWWGRGRRSLFLDIGALGRVRHDGTLIGGV